MLASRSPRRRGLLESAGYRFAVLPSEDGVEERAEKGELRDADPISFVATLAYLKAQNVVERLTAPSDDARRDIAAQLSDVDERAPIVVVSCDSVAVCRGEILGKPDGRADAERMLRKLSGSKHAVHTGLTVWKIGANSRDDDLVARRVETSVLQMEPLSDERLFAYLESGLWEGKAGAFGYQDGNDWLRLLTGTASNVVGLPTETLAFVLTRIVP
ncbi:MAG: Maf-like protein [Thermoguttaceae bacterium]|nr:Maf-like protein [Thermoguttaceae bacterium]